MRTRPGYVWTEDTWAQRGDKWHQIAGHWEAAPVNTPIVVPSGVEPFAQPPVAEEEEEVVEQTPPPEETTEAVTTKSKASKKKAVKGKRSHKTRKTPPYSDTTYWASPRKR
jgi:hypothetical protein